MSPLRLFVASVALASMAAKAAAAPATAAEADGVERDAPSTTTFEALATGAVSTTDLATLLVPFVESCQGEKRDLDRIRCRATQAYLRDALPRRAFLVTVDDAAAISLSEYDASIKGYHLTLAGCLACTTPVTIGRSNQRRLLTVKMPEKGADSLQQSVVISRSTLAFDSLVEARKWLDEVRPSLRAEFLFVPEDNEWSFGPGRGYAFKLLAGRIYDRCTGEVLVSRPPSQGPAPRPAVGWQDQACGRGRNDGDAVATDGDDEDVPAQLTKRAIEDSMGKVRAEVGACYAAHGVAGTVQLAYVVAGTGLVQSIRIAGTMDGTPTGACVLEAGKKAKFRPFRAPSQSFVYPFFLRR